MNQNKKENTHVLDRTAKRHKWRPLREQDGNELGGRYSCVVTRAYVSKVKFTSGSRPRSSRPRILRSLIRGGRAPRAPPLDRPLMLRRKFNSLYWGFLIKGFVGGFTVSYNKSDVKITGFQFPFLQLRPQGFSLKKWVGREKPWGRGCLFLMFFIYLTYWQTHFHKREDDGRKQRHSMGVVSTLITLIKQNNNEQRREGTELIYNVMTWVCLFRLSNMASLTA